MKAKDKLKVKVVRKFFIRSKTSNGEFAKQYFIVTKSNIHEPALLIRKLILSEDFELYKDATLLKTFKGNGLYEMRFSLKISTLKQVIYILFKQLIKQDD